MPNSDSQYNPLKHLLIELMHWRYADRTNQAELDIEETVSWGLEGSALQSLMRMLIIVYGENVTLNIRRANHILQYEVELATIKPDAAREYHVEGSPFQANPAYIERIAPDFEKTIIATADNEYGLLAALTGHWNEALQQPYDAKRFDPTLHETRTDQKPPEVIAYCEFPDDFENLEADFEDLEQAALNTVYQRHDQRIREHAESKYPFVNLELMNNETGTVHQVEMNPAAMEIEVVETDDGDELWLNLDDWFAEQCAAIGFEAGEVANLRIWSGHRMYMVEEIFEPIEVGNANNPKLASLGNRLQEARVALLQHFTPYDALEIPVDDQGEFHEQWQTPEGIREVYGTHVNAMNIPTTIYLCVEPPRDIHLLMHEALDALEPIDGHLVLTQMESNFDDEFDKYQTEGSLQLCAVVDGDKTRTIARLGGETDLVCLLANIQRRTPQAVERLQFVLREQETRSHELSWESLN